ncbi:MAG: hypothetical protein WCT39_00345 [Candidatus Margulisiibacteriota bacterium]
MANLELEFRYETVKRKVLGRIEEIKREWETTWTEAQGHPEAEAKLIALKLKIQLMETEAQDELRELEQQIAGIG